MSQTKEELIKENARLEQINKEFSETDTRRRKEFAKAFSWVKPYNPYDNNIKEFLDPTWPEIYIQMGKLLATKSFMDFEGNVSQLERKLADVEKNIKKDDINPNFPSGNSYLTT